MATGKLIGRLSIESCSDGAENAGERNHKMSIYYVLVCVRLLRSVRWMLGA
jgi:hypothetical protein